MTPAKRLLSTLTEIAHRLKVECALGALKQSPAPDCFIVFTPLAEVCEVHADNLPVIDSAEVRISLYTRHNYLDLVEKLVKTLLENELTISARSYVGFEQDTGYHHYALDVMCWSSTSQESERTVDTYGHNRS